MKRLLLKRLLPAASVAALAVALPASAQARSCGQNNTLTQGATVHVDAYGAASCSFARATSSRLYAVDGVPGHLRVRGIRLTHRGTWTGSGWIRWRYRGRRHRRALIVTITQRDSAPTPTPTPTPTTPPTPTPTPTPTSCDPDYQGACLDPYAIDYDCLGGSGNGPLYTGRVIVVGYDHYGLDADHDGIGCESS